MVFYFWVCFGGKHKQTAYIEIFSQTNQSNSFNELIISINFEFVLFYKSVEIDLNINWIKQQLPGAARTRAEYSDKLSSSKLKWEKPSANSKMAVIKSSLSKENKN